MYSQQQLLFKRCDFFYQFVLRRHHHKVHPKDGVGPRGIYPQGIFCTGNSKSLSLRPELLPIQLVCISFMASLKSTRLQAFEQTVGIFSNTQVAIAAAFS
jgi:hypothetical protein